MQRVILHKDDDQLQSNEQDKIESWMVGGATGQHLVYPNKKNTLSEDHSQKKRMHAAEFCSTSEKKTDRHDRMAIPFVLND